jgi:hypothetical protein
MQKDAFLRMQFHAQHTYYHQQFPDAAYDVVESDGVPVGRLDVGRAMTCRKASRGGPSRRRRSRTSQTPEYSAGNETLFIFTSSSQY